jgi:hypothetical protein
MKDKNSPTKFPEGGVAMLARIKKKKSVAKIGIAWATPL